MKTDTPSPAKTKLDELEKKIAQLKARKEKILAVASRKDRAKRTRQAIILGSWLMANEPAKVAQIVAGLTRDQDKKAFD
jgi:hypothetical protein